MSYTPVMRYYASQLQSGTITSVPAASAGCWDMDSMQAQHGGWCDITVKWDWRLWILSTCITSYLIFTVLCSITIGCCQSHPVMGERYSSNQVRVLHFTVGSAVAFFRCGGLVHYLWNFLRCYCSVYQNWLFFDTQIIQEIVGWRFLRRYIWQLAEYCCMILILSYVPSGSRYCVVCCCILISSFICIRELLYIL